MTTVPDVMRSRREVLGLFPLAMSPWRAFAAATPPPEVLLASIAKRYRDMKGVSIEGTTQLQNGGASAGNSTFRLRVRPPATLYEMNAAGPSPSRLILWTDGKRLRTFESRTRSFFDGEITARTDLTDSMLAGIEKARFLYWERFFQLGAAEAVSKEVKIAKAKTDAGTLECFRLEIRLAKNRFEILANGAKETLWIETTSGIVIRSDVQTIQRGVPVLQTTLWNLVDPGLPSEEAVTLTRPPDSVVVDKPALPGK